MKRMIWTFAALCVAVVTSEAALIAQAKPVEQLPTQAPGAPPIAVSPLQPDARETREQLVSTGCPQHFADQMRVTFTTHEDIVRKTGGDYRIYFS